MLTFGNVPEKLNLPENKIQGLDTKTQYSLDIFTAGTRLSREKQTYISLVGNGGISDRQKEIKVYDFDLYSKPINRTGYKIKPGTDKMKSTEVYGINTLFFTLCSIKNASDQDKFSDFSGFICDNNLVFCVDGRVFVTSASKFTEAYEIARGVEIYSYDRNTVYISVIQKVDRGDGVKKEQIYSYSLIDKQLRLCKIQFDR